MAGVNNRLFVSSHWLFIYRHSIHSAQSIGQFPTRRKKKQWKGNNNDLSVIILKCEKGDLIRFPSMFKIMIFRYC